MMMSHQQQAMVESEDEWERRSDRRNGRIGELQRERKHTKGMTFQGWCRGSRLRTLLGGMKPVLSASHPIRENRRIERHDLCLF